MRRPVFVIPVLLTLAAGPSWAQGKKPATATKAEPQTASWLAPYRPLADQILRTAKSAENADEDRFQQGVHFVPFHFWYSASNSSREQRGRSTVRTVKLYSFITSGCCTRN